MSKAYDVSDITIIRITDRKFSTKPFWSGNFPGASP
jgi:hypothetical protein